jgi:hypothetical protein
MIPDSNSRFAMAFEAKLKDHERTDANGKWVFVVLAGVFISGLGLHGILAGFLNALKHKPPITDRWEPVPRTARQAPSTLKYPLLQISPPINLRDFRAGEDAELHSYGWVDRTGRVLRIPIDRAMDLVLKEGFPTRKGAKTNQLGPSTYQLIRQRTEHRQPEIQGEK